MILPTKHIPQDQALIGIGASLLTHLTKPHTVTSLWEKVRMDSNVGTYERFILGLDLLHILGMITLQNGILTRQAK